MTLYITLTTLLHMFAFAIGQLPILMLISFNRINSVFKYDYQSTLRILPISVLLIIVSAYKVISLALYGTNQSIAMNVNVSLFFAIVFIACVCLSIYYIIERAIHTFKGKKKKKVINIVLALSILLAIFTLFQLISLSQNNDINYIDLAINYIYPILTGVLVLASIGALFRFNRITKQLKTYSILFISSLPLIILDVFFAELTNILFVSLPYMVYIILVFVEMLDSAKNPRSISLNKNDSFKNKYGLTDREMDVLSLAAKGMTNQEISDKLFVSVHTIKSHLQHIFSKLNISARYQLINLAKEIIDDSDNKTE